MAFAIAVLSGMAVVGLAEDTFYSAADGGFWNAWRVHPISIFSGVLAFLAVLYFLQRITENKHALQYLQPFTPLLGASGANVALKLNSVWLLPVAVFSIVWSVAQVRRLREGKLLSGRDRL